MTLVFRVHIQFSHSVVSDSLVPHGLQHARPSCLSPTPRVHPNPCPLSQWCHPIISSSVIPFSSCPQSFPESGSFPVSQLFASGGQRIGVSMSTSVLPRNTQDWSPLGWTGWISLQSKGLSRVSRVSRVFPLSKYFICFTTFHLCGNFFCKAEGPGPLLLTTGLVARIWCSHCRDPAQSPSPTPSHCRLVPLEISS